MKTKTEPKKRKRRPYKTSKFKKPDGEELRLPTKWVSGISENGAVLDTLVDVDDQVFLSAERYRKILQTDDEFPDEPPRRKNSESVSSYLGWLKKHGY